MKRLMLSSDAFIKRINIMQKKAVDAGFDAVIIVSSEAHVADVGFSDDLCHVGRGKSSEVISSSFPPCTVYHILHKLRVQLF